jgi:hypothetical protein
MVKSMAHQEEKLDKVKEKAAKVEPIKHKDKRAGKRKGLLDTCQLYWTQGHFALASDDARSCKSEIYPGLFEQLTGRYN